MAVSLRTDWVVSFNEEFVPLGAVGFDDGAMYTHAAAGLDDTDLTLACWVYTRDARNVFKGFLGVDNAAAEYWIMVLKNAANTFTLAHAGDHPISQAASVDTWYYVALVLHNTTGVVDYYIVPDGADLTLSNLYEMTGSITSPASSLHIGNDGFDAYLNGMVAQVKVWTAALTQAEIETEMPLDGVARTDDLWGYYSFREGPQTVDESGEGHTLTVTGTPTTEIAPGVVG